MPVTIEMSAEPSLGSSASPLHPCIHLDPPAAQPVGNGHAIRADPPSPIKLPPQRLIILCDGTWQARLDVEAHEDTGKAGKTATGKDGWFKAGTFFTNVSLLAQILEPVGKDRDGNEIRQTVLYQSGIGAVPDLFGRLFEGATGNTLPEKVMEAYGWICDNYNPVGPGQEPDKLYLFGFSRGAYTARTIAGFLAWAGVMTRQQCSTHFKAIWEAYHARDASDPDTLAHADDVLFQRLGKYPSPYASHAAQVAKDNARRLGATSPFNKLSALIKDPLRLSQTLGWDEDFRPTARDPADCVESAPIEVVGVWDTVGALGTPGLFERPETLRYDSFFDPIPAPTIKHALHALSLGEDREDFSPTLWLVPPGPDPTTEGELDFDPHYTLERPEDTELRRGQTVKQVWFKGSHSDVGGGYSFHGLSDITLAWMVGQLVDAKDGPLLSIDLDKLRSLQDRRRAWGRQPEHPSRGVFQFQKYRAVMPYTDSKIKARLEATSGYWRNVVEAGDTFESLHYSVTLGDEYVFDDGRPDLGPGGEGKGIPPVFSTIARVDNGRGESKLRELWAEAVESVPTGTEASLMWSLKKPQVQDAECETIAGLPVCIRPQEQEVDLDLRPERPTWLPHILWQLFIWVIELPLRLSVMLANILNGRLDFWEVHERNLQPFFTTSLIQASKTWPAKLRQVLKRAEAPRRPPSRAQSMCPPSSSKHKPLKQHPKCD